MDISFNEENSINVIKQQIIIAKQQRNGRKCWTLIENFADDRPIDEIKKFIKLVKKTKCCNGNYQAGDKIIQLQGDHTEFVKDLICDKYEYNEEDILIKGV
jgi:translation initiation factor SUI1